MPKVREVRRKKSGPIDITVNRPEFLSDQQKIILDAKNKMVVMGCATKAGKTAGLTQLAIETMMKGKRVVWIASTYRRSTMVFEALTKALLPLGQDDQTRVNIATVTIEVHSTGGTFAAYSGQDQKSVEAIFGDAADVVVIDEATRCHESVLFAATSLTTSTAGQIFLAMNLDKPAKNNWAIQEYMKYQYAKDPDVLVLSMTAYDSPFIKRETIEQARQKLPKRIFESLYMNIIPEDGDTCVFRDFAACIRGEEEDPKPGHKYLISVDPARKVDYTAIMVMDINRRQIVKMERDHGYTWSQNVSAVTSMSQKYNNARVIVDASAQQDMFSETLARYGLNTKAFKFTSANKGQVIEKLIVGLEQRSISFYYNEDLINELKNFEITVRDNGYIDYSAAAGQHDDLVTALALCNWELAGVSMFNQSAFTPIMGRSEFGNAETYAFA